MRIVFAFLFSLALSSCCCKKENELTRFYEDGRAKPIIAFVSMIDSASFDIPWSLSDELTASCIDQISKEKNIFVVRQDELPGNENPFGPDISWMKKEYPNQEFIVFTDLVEHECVPVTKNGKVTIDLPFETSTQIKMGVRVRVVDLRNKEPQIVLQEMIRDSHFIPRTVIPTDYSVASWGTPSYAGTPMEVAHYHFVQEITTRVSEYVHLAKSR